MFMFLALLILYPNDRLTEFAMATKACHAAMLYQRPLNLMRSLSGPLKGSILREKKGFFCRHIYICATKSLDPLLRMHMQGNKVHSHCGGFFAKFSVADSAL